MSTRIYFLSFFLCVILVGKCTGEKVLDEVLDDVLTAVEKAVAFYAENYADMNIDGIFGLRVIEGQLERILDFLQTESPVESDLLPVYDRLKETYHRSKEISGSALRVLQESDQHYLRLMRAVIERPWLYSKNYRRIDPMLKWKNASVPVHGLDERLSDQCMSELMRGGCAISKECVTVMSTRGMNGYAITHQLLYTMLAEERGCLHILNAELNRLPNQSLNVERLQVEFCANNFYETSSSVLRQNKSIGLEFQDLFLEQELVCTMLGFVEFLHNDWLRQILSWQMPSGCFGEPELQREGLPKREQSDSRTGGNDRVDYKQSTHVIRHARPDEPLPLTSVGSISPGKPESLGNDEMSNVIAPLARVIPIPAGLNRREEFVGLNSNVRKSAYNDSKIRRGMPVIGMNPMDKERGKLGKRHIKLDRENSFMEPAVGEFNRERGRVGDTRVRMKGKVDEQGIRRFGNIHSRLIPMVETDGGDSRPRAAPDDESFGINRQINRKLLYEKPLKDGCMAHKTAVAMGALSQYLRFLIVGNSHGFNATNHLFGTNYLANPDSLPPSFAPTVTGLMKKTLLSFPRKPATPAFMKSSKKIKLPSGEDENESRHRKRIDLSGPRDGQVIHFENRNTPALDVAVQLPADTKGSDREAIGNMDQGKSDPTPELEPYEEGDESEATGLEHPIVKSGEDDLLRYDELVNTKPEAPEAAGLLQRLVAKASDFPSSGDASFEGVASVSSTYAIVVVITAVILLLLYRSLRRHRTSGQHRHGRWK